MAKPILGDIFIGNFPVTQGYGGNPDMYKQFGLAGHNGIDFGTPTGTPIVSATDGVIVRIGWDPYGYGNYVEVWDEAQLCATLYAHLKSINVTMNEKVIRGQLLGYSNNTGNSTGPHLHFGYCRTDASGVRTNKDNGYAGWINPNAYATWDIKNLTEPIPAQLPQTPDYAHELDLCRVSRDNHWNDLMAIKDRFRIPGEYSLTLILGEIDQALTYGDKVREYEKQLSQVKDQATSLASELKTKTDQLQKINEDILTMQKTVEHAIQENELLQRVVSELKKAATPVQLTGWKKKIFDFLTIL